MTKGIVTICIATFLLTACEDAQVSDNDTDIVDEKKVKREYYEVKEELEESHEEIKESSIELKEDIKEEIHESEEENNSMEKF